MLTTQKILLQCNNIVQQEVQLKDISLIKNYYITIRIHKFILKI